ncbi:hypothetical protein GCM10020331_087640 [Ectobacillus funiculus]
MKTVLESSIHLPDLTFVDLCESNYGINRGVYNTIDAWFYKHGLKDILDRRRNILSFLEFIKPKNRLRKELSAEVWTWRFSYKNYRNIVQIII